MLKRPGNICSPQAARTDGRPMNRMKPPQIPTTDFYISKEERIASSKIPQLVKYMTT
jgi:hypothetical protein